MTELNDFVLNYCRHIGALVELSSDGIYDVLLPDEWSARWKIPALQRFVFKDPAPSQTAPADLTHLSYGHPLVEQIADLVRDEPLCSRLYINTVRLDKQGLGDLARGAIALPNARLVEAPRQIEARVMSHYVRFNFKAALITDEKQEQLVSVVMDAQAGHEVKELAHIEELALLEREPAFKNLMPAPLRWCKEANPLSRTALGELLERAKLAALEGMAPLLDSLQRHAAHLLDLDRARLNEYYDQMERDLQRRIDRAADKGRRAAAESKLSAVRTERQAKLSDVVAKYRLRVELALINLLVVEQPKVIRVVQIENRTTAVTRTVVWDPLLHRIEPLVCDACGRPSTRLFLCSGGHLAHEECLLPQCVDCKRVYCRLCESDMSACVVCDRPVCTHSLNRCRDCGRGTCHEHVGLCHADQGQPAKIAAPAPAALPESPPAPPPAQKQEPDKPRLSSLRRKKAERAVATRQAKRHSIEKSGPVPPYKVEVLIEQKAPIVHANVLTSGGKPIAARTWSLEQEGIAVECQCEKFPGCLADGQLLKPEQARLIEAQMETQLEILCAEYRVPPKRVTLYTILHENLRPLPRLILRGDWKDEEMLSSARTAFEKGFSLGER